MRPVAHSEDEATLAFYRQEAENYCNRTGTRRTASLEEFLSHLPAGASILELGCGSGRDTDQPSIGILLCKSRNELIVEYTLRDTTKPMGVSQYRLATTLPDQLQGQLPTRDELAREMPYLPVVALRIDIERALRRFMALRGLEPSRAVGIRQALLELKESGEVPESAEAFLRANAVMNKAAHGLPLEPSETAEAVNRHRSSWPNSTGLWAS
jgi:YhcG PDDEXK nuclease domain